MTDQFHRLLMRVQKPARYVGGEYNQIIDVYKRQG